MGIVQDELNQMVVEALENNDPGELRIHEEIAERLERCFCARDILVLIAKLFKKQSARTWATSLHQPDQTEKARIEALTLMRASQRIDEILRGTDGTRRTT